MKKQNRLLSAFLTIALSAALFAGCTSDDSKKTAVTTDAGNVTVGTTVVTEDVIPSDQLLDPGIYINGELLDLSAEGTVDLSMLSVENGLVVQWVGNDGETVYVNGEEIKDSKKLDITSITRDAAIDIEVKKGDTTSAYKINLMPSTFPDYETKGESTTDGDFYLSTYDLSSNYIFKINNKGELIFYRAITKTDKDGKEVNTNGLDFRKQYTSTGEVRYTYMPYLDDIFAGDCAGINPGSVVVMDENYNVIDEVFYLTEDGEEIKIDPHGFIWIDEGHYILTAYKEELHDVPADVDATADKVDLAVLYIEEIKDGEVLWEFCSADYEQFIGESNSIDWTKGEDYCHDYVHFNSMHYDADGNILVSCRHLDAILKISTTDGSLIWQLGGDNDEFGLTKDQLFSYQHSIILTDDGSYMLFDNADTAVWAGDATVSSVVRITADEDAKTVTDFVRYNVVDFFSIYMGAIREIDSDNSVYLWSVGGNYQTDSKNPPEWSMVEYTEVDGEAQHNFCFRFKEGTRRLYCSNKCK